MPASKRVDAAATTFSDLDVLFEQYELDTPESSFPSFLETLLFDRASRGPLPPPAPRGAGLQLKADAEGECGREFAHLHPRSSVRH